MHFPPKPTDLPFLFVFRHRASIETFDVCISHRSPVTSRFCCFSDSRGLFHVSPRVHTNLGVYFSRFPIYSSTFHRGYRRMWGSILRVFGRIISHSTDGTHEFGCAFCVFFDEKRENQAKNCSPPCCGVLVFLGTPRSHTHTP